MKSGKFVLSKPVLIVVITLFILVITPQKVSANIRIENGGEVPYYARLERGGIHADGDWVAIVFYRPPSCIPADFNLLNFFDFANAWNCQPTTTTGFEIWKNGPGIDMAPIQQVMQGKGAVPVWFVNTQQLMAAIGDDILTINELASLPSLQVGSASFYHETLHPLGGSNQNHLVFNAHGQLEDGTPFIVHAEHTESNFITNIRFNE
jgi:hypothetical protein